MGRSSNLAERTLTLLVACWCLIPVFVVFGFFFWATIEASWPWNLVFGAAAAAIFAAFVVFGGKLCAQCRTRREGKSG